MTNEMNDRIAELMRALPPSERAEFLTLLQREIVEKTAPADLLVRFAAGLIAVDEVFSASELRRDKDSMIAALNYAENLATLARQFADRHPQQFAGKIDRERDVIKSIQRITRQAAPEGRKT